MAIIKASQEVSSERKRILVAFGDIRGYGHWLKRAGTSPEEQISLISKFYSRVLTMSETKGYYVKMLGDGFLIVRELEEINNWSTVLKDLYLFSCLSKTVQRDITELPNPRPDGFRIRVVAGHASKVLARTCPNGKLCKSQHDYVGYPINFASRLLHVLPEIPCICHESIREIVGHRNEIVGSRKGEGFKIEFKRLDIPKIREKGVDSEDLRELWSFGKICKCPKGEEKHYRHERSGKEITR